MSADQLVGELQEAGVTLWEDDGQLRYRAARGVMTPERLAALKAQKEAVLAHLRNPMRAALTPAPQDRFAPFPVTDVQAAYLLGRRDVFAYGGVACHGYGELTYPDLDPERLERAWQRLVARHDMLRAVLTADGAQQVRESVPDYRVAVVDMRDATPEHFAAAVAAVRSELGHKVYQPDVWPLFELRVVRGAAHSVLHFSIDFLIADFVSIEVILDELHRLYADPDTPLSELELTYRDYRLAETRIRTGPGYERDKAYWLDRVDDLPPAPDLPVLPGSASGGPGRFRRYEARIEPALWAELRERAGRHGVSPSTAVLAAFNETIAAWSRSPRFTVDVTLLQRLPVHDQVDRLVGDFTSVSLLAVDRAAGATFAERAAAAQSQLWQDLDHRLFSGVEVMREIGRRHGADAALMPVVFTSAIGLAAEADDGGASGRGEFTYGISQTPQVWIDCQNIERRGGLATNWDVREGVLPEAVVADAFAAYEDLLRRLAAADDAWRDRRPLRLPEAQLARRAAANATAAPLPDGLLHDGFLATAAATPDRIAVVAGDRTLTYGETAARSAAVAESLRSQGIRAGEPVAVVMDKGWEQVVAVLGVLRAGGAYLPVDTNQPAHRRDRILADAGVRLVLTQSWQGLDGTAVDTLDPADNTPPSPATPDDLAYVIYTSGSTGTPKGVMISHRQALNTIVDLNARFGVGAGDRVLGLANLGFDLSVYDIFGPLSVGGAIVLPAASRRGDPSHWAALVADHGVTVWNSVPAQAQMLADYLTAATAVTLPTLRLALLSGDWIPVTLPDLLRSRVPTLRLVSLGGATEAAIWSIHHEIGEVPAEWRSIPYGRPLKNQTFHVLDAGLAPCPDGVAGELYIGGAGVAMGYLNDPERTAQRFVTHPETGERLYRTGDLGRYLPDGEIEFLGREDFQVKIRGHRIELAEIEAVLLSHPGVESAVCVADGTALDRQLAAFVEPSRATGSRPAGAVAAAQPPAGGTAATGSSGGGEAPVGGGAGDGGATADVVAATAALMRKAADAGAGIMAGVDRERYRAYTRGLDDLALVTILGLLAEEGLFADGASHDADEVVGLLQADARHHRLVKRWLHTLAAEGLLDRDDDGRYTLTAAGAARRDTDAADRWQEVVDLGSGIDDVRLLDYFRGSAARLGDLVRGDEDPLTLLFPQGRVDVSDDLYAKALFNRWANAVTADAVAAVAAAHTGPGPLRVLEVGAGAGGTSAGILAALAAAAEQTGVAVDYLYTDLSQFFLNAAQERFADYPWLRFAVFDLDRDPHPQGLSGNAFDVIIAGDVLHATRDVGAALARLATVAAPGCWLVVQEMTRDHFQIMTSLELLVRLDDQTGDFADERRGQHQTFVRPDQWQRLLAGAGAHALCGAPEGDDLLDEIGMRVMLARFKTARARITPQELTGYAAGRLPDYMVPPTIEVVDGLPVTANGKVDRAKLLTLLPTRGGAAATVDDAANADSDLERRLAAIWARVLKVDAVGRRQSFYELGGDSLLAAQLAGRLMEEVPEADLFFDELLRLILDQPTVAALATALLDQQTARAATPAAESTKEAGPTLVRRAEAGAATPLVRVCPLGPPPGDPARDVAFELVGAAGLPVATLDPVVLLGRLADAYTDAVTDAGLDALRLVGHGLDATITVEVARRLTELGVDVQELTLMAPETLAKRTDDGALTDLLLARRLGAASPGLPDAALAGWRDRPAADRLASIATAAGVDAATVDAVRELHHALVVSSAASGGDVYFGDATVLVPPTADAFAAWFADPATVWPDRCLGEVTITTAPTGQPIAVTGVGGPAAMAGTGEAVAVAGGAEPAEAVGSAAMAGGGPSVAVAGGVEPAEAVEAR